MVNLSSFYHCYKETFQFDSTLSQALLYSQSSCYRSIVAEPC